MIQQVLRFFGKYPVMDICPLLPDCHGSEIMFDWSMGFLEGQNKETIDGLVQN